VGGVIRTGSLSVGTESESEVGGSDERTPQRTVRSSLLPKRPALRNIFYKIFYAKIPRIGLSGGSVILNGQTSHEGTTMSGAKCEKCSDSGLYEQAGLIAICRECRKGRERMEAHLLEKLRHHGDQLRSARSELSHLRSAGVSPFIIPN
jgi:hypothetical protein